MAGIVPSTGYTPLAKTLHWITALLVLGMLSVGLWMVDLPIGLLKLQAYAWHKWIGLVVLVLTVLRLGWRWRSPPPPLPGTLTVWHRRVAPWSHGALLVLLLTMPISGWRMSSAGGVRGVLVRRAAAARPGARDPGLFDVLRTVHHKLAWLLIAVLALHVGAVVHHDVLRRDGVFRRMWPV